MIKEYIYIIIFIIILILFYLINNKNKYLNQYKELFSGGKIPPTTRFGSINDKRWISLYDSQNSIFSSNENKYWKDFPKEYNTDFPQDLPVPIQDSQLALPVWAKGGDNTYRKGLINYFEFTKYITDKNKPEDFGKWDELLLKPTDFTPLKYKYELEFEYDMLNRKSWIDRWEQYNPVKKMHFKYDEIKSPIDEVNQLNKEFLNRCYKQQENVLDKKQLTYFGIIPFDIYKYAIQKIEYLVDNTQNKINIESYENKNKQPRLFSIKIMLFRESDFFLPTLSYIGTIINNKAYIMNGQYLGGLTQDKYLMAKPFEKEPTYQIINKNYTNQTNTAILQLNPDSVVKQVKEYQESYKLNNQWACFNTDPDVLTNPEKSAQILVTNNFSDRNNYVPTREHCESSFDWYGRPKQVGILDRPCKTDDECPFYQGNRNYPNKKGKCLPDGQCEMPVGVQPLGFHYFFPSYKYRPLCYNCKSDKWLLNTKLEDCCEEQNNKNKYPFLNGPDYAFEGDKQDRINHYYSLNCYNNVKGERICK